ncbi:MAG TPA: hypothetical protein VFC68_06020 [Treponemataceae bacterium]|nr:hypothetical protein [Treponemataceae bacterium]
MKFAHVLISLFVFSTCLYAQVIYEINFSAFSNNGNFSGVTERLPEL